MSEAPDEAPDEVPGGRDGDSVSTAAQDRAREGIDHLQNAARELIAAARAALDVAEDLIDDPDTIASVVGSAGQLGGLGDIVRSLLPTGRVRSDRRSAGDPLDHELARQADDASEAAIQRIEVV